MKDFTAATCSRCCKWWRRSESHERPKSLGEFVLLADARSNPPRLSTLGGGSAISELNLTDDSARTIWKGPEGIHAFGNFPNFALSKDGKVAAAVRSTYNSPPEVFAGPLDEWRQVTNNNADLRRTGATRRASSGRMKNLIFRAG